MMVCHHMGGDGEVEDGDLYVGCGLLCSVSLDCYCRLHAFLID
jgi:hypothetical protein